MLRDTAPAPVGVNGKCLQHAVRSGCVGMRYYGALSIRGSKSRECRSVGEWPGLGRVSLYNGSVSERAWWEAILSCRADVFKQGSRFCGRKSAKWLGARGG